MIIQREGRANRKSTDLSGENEVKLLKNEILESIATLIYYNLEITFMYKNNE